MSIQQIQDLYNPTQQEEQVDKQVSTEDEVGEVKSQMMGYSAKSPRRPIRTVVRSQADDIVPDKKPTEETEIRGQDQDMTANQSGTTGFVNQGVTNKNKLLSPNDLDSIIVNAGSTAYEQGLKEFLAKPIQMQQFAFNSSYNAANLISQLNLDATTLFSNQPTWGCKVLGFQGIRGTVRARLQVNGNPFQQGRLIMSYIPMAQHYNKSYNRLGSLTTITQLPNVQVDVNCDSEGTLDIPYTTLQSHHNLVNGEGAWGVLYISCYIPFSTGSSGSSDVQCTLWISLHDVELVTPSVPFTQAVTSQSNEVSVPKMVRRGRSKKKEPTDEEAQHTGPVSSIFSKVKTIATAMSDIPLISSYAGTTAWAAGILANSAAAFGWGKPISQDPVIRMNRTLNQYQNYYDGKDNAMNMGISCQNHVRTMAALGGSDMDEMSIDYLKGIPVWITNVGWNTTNAAQFVLWEYDLIPINQGHNVSGMVGTKGGIVCGPMQYIASMFQYYRGGIIVKFKFAKTQFHSGRLQILYSPGYRAKANQGNPAAAPTITPTFAQQTYLHREIIDLRCEGNEFEYYFPYVSFYPYLECTTSFGKLQVLVQNQLKAPASVSTAIQFGVEVRAASDMEFAKPSTPYIFPTTVDVYAQSGQIGDTKTERRGRKIRSQANDDDCSKSKDDCKITVMKPIGNSQMNGKTRTDFAETCIGEQVKSVKQLAQRACWLPVKWGFGSVIRPFVIGCLPISPISSRVFEPIDTYSAIASMYAYSRGGIVIRYIESESSGLPFAYQLSDDYGPALTPNNPPRLYGNSTIVEKPGVNLASVYIPQYTITHGRLNAPDNGNLVGAGLGAQPPYKSSTVLTRFRWDQNTPDNGVYAMMRSAADDTQFGFFLGVPPCQVNPNATITT